MYAQKTRYPSIDARFILMLLTAWFIWTINLNVPFFGHHEGAAIWISAAVRNFDIYGATELGLVPLINYAPTTPETYLYYVHHPPLIVWLSSVLSSLVGLSNFSIRLTVIFLSLISLTCLYVLVRRMTHNPSTALWGAAFYLFTPMIMYYGRSPNHEPLSMMVILLFSVIFVAWYRRPTRKRWLALACLSSVAAFSSWASMLGLGLIGVMGLIFGKHYHRRDIIGLGFVGAISLVIMLGLYQLQWDGALDNLLTAYNFRTSDYTHYDQTATFTPLEFFNRQLSELTLFFMPALLIFGVLGTRLLRSRLRYFDAMIVFALFLTGLIYLLLLPNATYEHDFLKVFLTPPLAICAALFMQDIAKRKHRLLKTLSTVLILVSVIGSIVFWGSLQLFSVNAALVPTQLVHILRSYTLETDHILTNLENLPAGVTYYSFRHIEGNIAQQNALERLSAMESFVYLYCGDNPLDIEFSLYRQEKVDDCSLIFMQSS